MAASRYSIFLGFIVGLVVGCASVFTWELSKETSPNLVTNAEFVLPIVSPLDATEISGAGKTVEPETILNPSAIVIANQKQGGTVLAQSVTAPEDAWLTIHEITKDDTVGTIIGAIIVESGKTVEMVTVPLLKQTQKKRYLATLYKENGDGVFTVGKDAVLKDDSGTILYTLFTID